MASPEAQDALWLSVRTCVIATVVDVFLGVPIAPVSYTHLTLPTNREV